MTKQHLRVADIAPPLASALDAHVVTASPRRMRRPQAADYLGVSKSFLEKAACRGDGPAYLRISARLVLYERDVLDAWAAAHRVGNSAEAVTAIATT